MNKRIAKKVNMEWLVSWFDGTNKPWRYHKHQYEAADRRMRRYNARHPEVVQARAEMPPYGPEDEMGLSHIDPPDPFGEKWGTP